MSEEKLELATHLDEAHADIFLAMDVLTRMGKLDLHNALEDALDTIDEVWTAMNLDEVWDSRK
jgi:hypothetical protein